MTAPRDLLLQGKLRALCDRCGFLRMGWSRQEALRSQTTWRKGRRLHLGWKAFGVATVGILSGSCSRSLLRSEFVLSHVSWED